MSLQAHALHISHMALALDERASKLTLALRAGGAPARRALVELHDAHAAMVAEVAMRTIPRHRDLALDAAQETWIRVAARPAHCHSAAELEAWLRRVAVTASIDVLRRELRQRMRAAALARSSTPPNTHAPSAASEALEYAERLEHLRSELRVLSASERTLLDLRFRAGMTIAQVAAAVGLGPDAAESRMRRVLARLRAMEESS